MKQPKLWALYAGYAAVVVGLSIWQIRSYHASFEPVQPYTHPGPAAERMLPAEDEPTEPEAERPTRSRKHPTEPETAEVTEPVTTDPPETDPPVVFPIDLNTADADALAQIPGIGPVTAAAIIDYRNAHGGFRNREELLQVHGIGEGRYHDLLGYVYLEHEEPLSADEPESSPAEEPPPEETSAPEPTEPPVINLNTAAREQLLLLPGCTEALADSILQLRDEIHVFQNILEINMAEGVTTAIYYTWEPYLAVNDSGDQALTNQEGQP